MVNVVTKSGSNKFHGTGFYSLRDSSFDASDPELAMKPSQQQHQFGFTVGGPLRRNRVFFFAGFDQHVFHEPTVVRFVNGETFVRPQPAAGQATPGDYEADDQALVFATAAQLSQQSGFYPSKLLGNAGFAKLDVTLSTRNQLALRVNTSRYSGTNNVFLDPSSPVTTVRHLRQWRRARRNRNRHRIAHQRSFLAADQPPAPAVFSRHAMVGEQLEFAADANSRNY